MNWARAAAMTELCRHALLSWIDGATPAVNPTPCAVRASHSASERTFAPSSVANGKILLRPGIAEYPFRLWLITPNRLRQTREITPSRGLAQRPAQRLSW